MTTTHDYYSCRSKNVKFTLLSVSAHDTIIIQVALGNGKLKQLSEHHNHTTIIHLDPGNRKLMLPPLAECQIVGKRFSIGENMHVPLGKC